MESMQGMQKGGGMTEALICVMGLLVGLIFGCMFRVSGRTDQGKDAWLAGYNEGYVDGVRRAPDGDNG